MMIPYPITKEEKINVLTRMKNIGIITETELKQYVRSQ